MADKIIGMDGKPIRDKGGRKKGYKHPPFAREKIKASALVNRAQDIAMGNADCSPSQARMLSVLLAKVLPDLRQTENTGTMPEVIVVDTGIRRTGTTDD